MASPCTKLPIPGTMEPPAGVVNTEGDKEPEGGYGWVVVGCMIGMNAVTWGVNTTYGVYSSYYLANDHFVGGTTLKYGWVGGTCVAVGLACAPLANWLSRRHGFRLPIILGAICIVLGQCMAGISTTFAQFLACQGIVFGLGLGLTLVPSQPLLAHYFDDRLALAQGLANGGSGLGGLILANTTRLALDHVGVKWSLIINGLISLVVLCPAVALLRGRHKATHSQSASLEIRWLWHPGFMWVWLWGSFASKPCSQAVPPKLSRPTVMAYFIALYSLASEATNGLGLTQTQGAALQSILSAGQMIGRPLTGLALDRIGRVNGATLAYVIIGVSCFAIWIPARGFGVLAFFAAVQGFFGGTIWSAAAPVCAEIAGVPAMAPAMSIFWLALVIPSLVGEPVAIALYNHSTNNLSFTGAQAYYISISFAGGCGLLSALLLYPARRYLRRMRDVRRV